VADIQMKLSTTKRKFCSAEADAPADCTFHDNVGLPSMGRFECRLLARIIREANIRTEAVYGLYAMARYARSSGSDAHGFFASNAALERFLAPSRLLRMRTV
jgi:hypothetical protein